MRRYIAPILWVLLGAIPAALYGWHFLGEWQRIGDSNQRDLGRAAENLKSILQNAVATVGNLTTKPAFLPTFLKQQQYLDLLQAARRRDDKVTRAELEAVHLTVENGLTVNAERSGLKFSVNLEKILDELVVAEGFEYLFVANEQGNVLFQTRRGEPKRWIDRLRWADRHARDESFKPVNPVRLSNIGELATVAGGGHAPASLINSTSSSHVTIAGEQYHLYLQPIGSLAEIAPGSASSSALVLGGLVNARASLAEALAVDPRLALGLALLAGLALLTWPLLKLFVLAPTERFRFVDFYLLLLSASALLMVLTVALLDFDNYLRLDSNRGNWLKPVANRLAESLFSELSDAARQLSAYDEKLARDTKGGMNCQDNRRIVLAFDPPGSQTLHVDLGAYRHWTFVFWAKGDDGTLFAGITRADEDRPFAGVFKRRYFQEARKQRLWQFADGVKDASGFAGGFFVQAVQSISTGEFKTALAMPSVIQCTGNSNASTPAFPNVAVLTTTLASLTPKALPDDYGFLVIDRSGRVLYHCDPRRALREDLFEEVSDPERLRALVMAERPEPIRIDYGSVPHELYIRPLSELRIAGSETMQSNGWFLVTFRDLRLAQTVNTEAALTALFWCTFYFVPFLFLPALILIMQGPKHNGWIWPNRAKKKLYRSLAVRLILLTAAACVAIGVARGWSLVAAACLIGIAAMGLAIWEYRRWKRGREQGGGRESGFLATVPDSWWQISAATLMFILVSVFPATAFFKFAWNQELGTLLSYEAKHVKDKMEDLTQEIKDSERFAEAANVEKEETKPNTQIAELWEDSKLGTADTRGPVDLLARWKPVYNDTSAALRFGESRPDLAVRQGLSMRPGLFALFGGVLLIGSLVRWIRHWAKHLLLSDLADTVPDATDVVREIQVARNEGRNLIIVTSSSPQESALRALMAAPGELEAPPAPAPGSTQSLPADAGGDTVLELSEVFRDAGRRQTELRRLERIAAAGHAILFTRVDPAVLVFGGAPVAAQSDATESATLEEWERRRWSDLLDRFWIVLAPLRIEAAAEQYGATGDAWLRRARSRPLYWSLWNSCTNMERLVLVQVAEEGFANPRQTETVERLLRRGLLAMKPDLRLFDPDFRQFIEEIYDRKIIAEWERPSHGLGWKQARWILATVVVTIGVFLLATQRQALTPVVAFVPTLTAAFAGIIKLVSEMTAKQQPASSET